MRLILEVLRYLTSGWSDVRNVWIAVEVVIFSLNEMVMLTFSGIVLFMCPANERWCYIVTLALIGWTHTQNDPCILMKFLPRGCSFDHFRFSQLSECYQQGNILVAQVAKNLWLCDQLCKHAQTPHCSVTIWLVRWNYGFCHPQILAAGVYTKFFW